MKNLTTISLFIFWAVVVAIGAAGLVIYNQNKTSVPVAVPTTSVKPTDTPSIAPSSSISQPAATPAPTSVTLNTSEVTKHNSESDCWMIINNKVYDVTSYISSHPDGTRSITGYCGKEATSAFGGHSSYANQLLVQYFVGDLR